MTVKIPRTHSGRTVIKNTLVSGQYIEENGKHYIRWQDRRFKSLPDVKVEVFPKTVKLLKGVQ